LAQAVCKPSSSNGNSFHKSHKLGPRTQARELGSLRFLVGSFFLFLFLRTLPLRARSDSSNSHSSCRNTTRTQQQQAESAAATLAIAIMSMQGPRPVRPPLPRTTREIIRPHGLSAADAVPYYSADTVPLLEYEMMFTQTPLANASYPAIALQLSTVDIPLLKESLSKALARNPFLAGRVRGSSIALTNDGVPFTVQYQRNSPFNDEVEEETLLQLADFRKPRRVLRGAEPLMTIKVTIAKNTGSAILVMCRSHGLLDGSSAWAFLNDWACLARGDGEPVARRNDDVLFEALPSTERLAEISQEVIGRQFQANEWKTKLANVLMPIVVPIYDSLWLSGITGQLKRARTWFDRSELRRLKESACPYADSWVSMQEAIAAWLIWNIARKTLPEDAPGVVSLLLLLDARKALGMSPNDLSGCGLVFAPMRLEGVRQMTFPEVAEYIHDECQAATTPEKLAARWKLTAGAAEVNGVFDVMMETMRAASQTDFALMLNNQFKRQLPNFGPAGGQTFMPTTNAGPTLMLPGKEGGMRIFFDESTLFKSAKTTADKNAAMMAIKMDVPYPEPKKPTNPKKNLSERSSDQWAAASGA